MPVTINRDSFVEAFQIYGATCTDIDLDRENQDYENHKNVLKKHKIPRYMPRSGNRSLIPIPDNVEEPFYLSTFHFYMKCTFYRLCKVLGMDGSNMVPTELLMMSMNIQHLEVNTDYDYVGYFV